MAVEPSSEKKNAFQFVRGRSRAGMNGKGGFDQLLAEQGSRFPCRAAEEPMVKGDFFMLTRRWRR